MSVETVTDAASGADPGVTAVSSADDTAAEAVVVERVTHGTGRWQGASAMALLATAAAIYFARPALLLVAAVPVGVLAVVAASNEPDPSLVVSRSIDRESPQPGETITVETTVTNVGEGLADVRLVDLVPAGVHVVEGSPRLGAPLPANAARTIRYDVRVRRGHHTFEGVRAICRDLAGAREVDCVIQSTDSFTCVPDPAPLSTVPLRALTTPYAGRIPTDQPGEGQEFHATREYRPGDALRRIDWNSYASTRDLGTVQFRTERAATVVVVADAREPTFVRSSPDAPAASDRCLDATARLSISYLDHGDNVGIGSLGRDAWIDPGSGDDHRNRLLHTLGTDPGFSPAPGGADLSVHQSLAWLRHRLPADAQVVVCTPLIDDDAARLVELLEAHGHAVSVVAPDPTSDGSAGRTLARLERDRRVDQVRELGVPVVDWQEDTSLERALLASVEGWSP